MHKNALSYSTIIKKLRQSQIKKKFKVFIITILIGLDIILIASLYHKNIALESIVRISNPYIQKIYYTFNNQRFQKDLAKQDFSRIANNPDELDKWLRSIGIEKVLEETQRDLLGSEDILKCHPIYHTIGQHAYQIFKNEAFSIFDQHCSAGYTHGLIYEYSINNQSDHLMNDLYNICSNVNSNSYKLECFHGIGHGVVVYQQYNLGKAIDQCGELPTQPVRNLCYSGAFMENFLAESGHGAMAMDKAVHLSDWATDDPFMPCSNLSSDPNIQSMCDIYQAGRMLDLFKGDFKKTAEFCQDNKILSRKMCFINLGEEAAIRQNEDPQKIIEVCGIKKKYFLSCIDGVIRHMVYFYADDLGDKGANLCKTLRANEDKIFCYKSLGERINELFYGIKTQEEIQAKCSGIEYSFKRECLEGTKKIPELF